MTHEDPSGVRTRAVAALRAVAASLGPADPFAASTWIAMDDLGEASDPRPLLAFWSSRERGNPVGEMRYRWELTHARAPLPAYAGDRESWTAWRPRERRTVIDDPTAAEARISVPVVVADTCELLARVASRGGDVGETARALLAEAEPVMRRDVAQHVQAQHAWTDTFALYCLADRPHAMERLRPLAVALASTYAATAQETGSVVGTRFPYHGASLVSASAQLASGLLALGLDTPLLARLHAFVASRVDDTGAWGDADEPADVLTTLVAADLVSHLDPSFDTARTVAALAARQSPDGLFRALGPDAPWTTAAIVALLDALTRPFGERFRWPRPTTLDHKTGVPFFAYFAELAELVVALPALAEAPIDLAFLDLAGFRAFNNRFGQNAGDAVLAELARFLERIPAARIIRDGGDEMLIVGAPTRPSLRPDLERFRAEWPAAMSARFGDDIPTVAPRILIASTPARGLLETREELGRRIGDLKHTHPSLPPEGVLGSL